MQVIAVRETDRWITIGKKRLKMQLEKNNAKIIMERGKKEEDEEMGGTE